MLNDMTMCEDSGGTHRVPHTPVLTARVGRDSQVLNPQKKKSKNGRGSAWEEEEIGNAHNQRLHTGSVVEDIVFVERL
jgi:hypothetical protein